ncbi:cation:proton antiporter [Halorientalis sp. IM1011]|uniref:MnhB domain-containing protein n=1 Tax=Halorientalis sp. IM1011 TaxID=1932360 RepID=UPI00097CD34C|nr:MnhB domain-containing protein [Halorientalis sp. IM1011]AQL41754.1 cation:proton antiporter [Halorientalis sp. IM1011]
MSGDDTETEATGVTRSLYVESPIIMATVRVVAPFVFTFGLFIMFHGADSAGGGFQGGVIVSTVILMLAIAFGVEATRDWIRPERLVAIVGIGVSVFLSIGIGTVVAGGGFLDYSAVPIYHASKYGIELVELAIGVIVSGIVAGLFFGLAVGATGEVPADSDSDERGGLL